MEQDGPMNLASLPELVALDSIVDGVRIPPSILRRLRRGSAAISASATPGCWKYNM
jgi:hypothetical protein